MFGLETRFGFARTSCYPWSRSSKVLDAFIIERIRRERERQKESGERIRVDIPPPRPEAPEGPKKPKRDRGVTIIDYGV